MTQQKPPLQNRVDPWGVLHAVPARGTLMGNRGILHDDQNRIVRPWAGKAWLSCLLTPPFEQKRSPFSEGTYSELFFLDEATSFSAGHRPCRSCQRSRYDTFKAAWSAVHAASTPSGASTTWLPIAAIDAVLHAERIGPDRSKRTHPAALADLPDGTVYQRGGEAWLVWRGRSLRWSFAGYQEAIEPPTAGEVAVLTPPSVVALFRTGFRPEVHPTANLYN